MKVIAGHDKRNYMVVRDDLTRAHRRRYLAGIVAANPGDADEIEAVLRETVLEVQIVIGDDEISGLDAVMEAFDARDDITPQVEGFWANAWLTAYRELQELGKPTPAR